jgi:hypothetical protein
MTQLIQPSDPQYFTNTSTEPYDRHNYILHYKDKTQQTYTDWQDLYLKWFQTPKQFLSHVEVIDVPTLRTPPPQGF